MTTTGSDSLVTRPVVVEALTTPAAAGAVTGKTMDLLRLITCGSVDDGKSTLIGRLLYDSKGIYQDQWEAVHRSSLKRGDERVDLAMLTDGLRAEREQGITIDVAYRYFSTPRRKFILADTPGHVQYTRNMATGASTADLAIILIDARQGVLEQTRRHAFLAALLGIGRLLVCVNKMDLIGWDQRVFTAIRDEFAGLLSTAEIFGRTEAEFIPVAALLGDNIVTRSEKMPWYTGPSVLEHIETVPTRPLRSCPHARFPVQWVIRPQTDEHHDYRGYAGEMAAGELRVGDEVLALPAGQRSRITRIHIGDRELDRCVAGQSVSILLADDVDIARGDMLVRAPMDGGAGAEAQPKVSREFDATIVWMGEQGLAGSGGGGGGGGKRYMIKHGTRYVRAILGPVKERVDLKTLRHAPAAEGSGLALNEIGRVGVRLASTIVFDAYAECRGTGGFIVIDEATNNTVGAGMIG